ncbi:helix-turn-helix domain-containing protein [Bombilactobacillus bombi]|uniref:helix-turn-helix domain-containing protein n=1 Tax=Bombilactobacillus bombi TaxID=1303590 RepID=UPI0015E5FC0C|nr:helix-turn-helix transcriptional regulator [Bombilactobacillus bombi]
MPRSKYTPQDLKNMQIISSNLKKLITDKAITQAEISLQTGIPASTLNGYFNATSLPNTQNLQKLAQFFKIQKSDLDPRFSITSSSLSKNATRIMQHLDEHLTANQIDEIIDFIDFIKSRPAKKNS